MTISYNADVSSSTSGAFFRLLLRWRGSVWKSIYRELTCWLVCFFAISIVYRFLLSDAHRVIFEDVAHFFYKYINFIPLTFMLGFFVTFVVNRWNEIFKHIGWIDSSALFIAAYVRGADKKTRMLRRTIVRYLVLNQALVFRDISMPVRKRFPTIDTLVAAGFLMEHEKQAFDDIQIPYAKYWLPTQWAWALLYEAHAQGKIGSDTQLQTIFDSIHIAGKLFPMVIRRLRQERLRTLTVGRAQRRRKNFQRLWDPLENYDDDQCVERFRFDKASVLYLVELLAPYLQRPTTHSRALPVIIQVATALRFYATGTFQNMVGDYLHISKASVCRIIRDVSYALAGMMDIFISFPTNLQTTKERFYEIARIPGVVGAIDCTHIRIQKTNKSQIFFMNRKGFHSINVQAICDADRCFLSVLAKFPGSAHDSRIFSQSAVCRDFAAGRVNGILLGDAGYACKSYLLTPYEVPRSHAEGRFNKYHTKTRVRIEQAFGCLKRRFHVLHGEVRLPDSNKKIWLYRSNLGTLCNYDWIPVPLVYPQVVFLSVRCYFIICLIGRQYMVTDRELENNSPIDLVFPIMTILQFVFYMGWMKVAEALLNPFGEDDDDFECNWLLDRNLTVGLTIVDDAYDKPPLLKRDAFWSEKTIEPLYSAESALRPHNPLIGSVADVDVTKEAEEVVMVPYAIDSEEAPEEERTIVPVSRTSSSRLSRVSSTRGSYTKRKLANSVKRKFSRLVSRTDRQPPIAQDDHNYKPQLSTVSITIGDIPSASSSMHSILDELAAESLHLPPANDEASGPQVSPRLLESVPEEENDAQSPRASRDDPMSG